MKKIFKKGLLCAFSAFILSAVMGIAPKADAASVTVRENPVIMPQVEIKEMTPVDEDAAYIVFTDTAQEKQMTFEDGFGKTEKTDLTYNEKVNFKGIVGRQVFYQNQIFLKLDPSFASPEDTTFKITFNYYDYGGAGYIHFDYTIPGTTDTYGRISVLKMGDPKGGTDEERYEKAKWWECTFYISDASFRQAMDYGGDIRIVTGGYNTFAKIEVTNLSRNAGVETFDLFNSKSANSLKVMGLFDEYSAENADAILGKELTREEALKYILQFAGLKEEAEKKNLPCSFTDVSLEYKPYVGMAESLGIIKNTGGTLGAKEPFPQSELCEWYSAFMGSDDPAVKTNPLTVVAGLNLINSGNMLFQPTKTVLMDNLVAFANNMLPLKNLKTGKCYLSDLYNSGRVTVDTFRETGDSSLINWLLMGEFYMPPEEHYDPETGRTYYTINILGEHAIKNYYTMPMTSTDDTRFYFRDKNSNIYEYNMKTYMVKYMCTGDPGIEHFFCVSAKNNLWYLDQYARICKINLDTYEETVVVHLPDAYQDITLNTGAMLQVDFNETALTVSNRDARYWENRQLGGSIHQYDIENNIWKNIFIGDFAKDFVTDYTYPGHLCQNPVKKNLVFYCHEGAKVNDRTWVMDIDTGEKWVGFPQKKYSPERTGEDGVHEYWLADGEYLLTVRGHNHHDEIRYNWGAETQTANARGIYFARWDGKDRYLVNGDYQYSHCATALNSNRWLISDVGIDSANGFTKLVLMDTEAGWSKVIVNHTKGNNPGHSHPQFSWDAKTAFFGLWSEDYKTVEVGWAYIGDITENPTPGSQIDLNEACSTYSYEGEDHFMIEHKDEKGTYFEVPKNNFMEVKVKPDYLEEEQTDVEIEITYLDNTYFPIKLDYFEWENISTYAKREKNHPDYYYEGIGKLHPRVEYIQRTNTGKWKTVKLTIHNINLENMFQLGADFKLSGLQSKAFIRDVFVKEVK